MNNPFKFKTPKFAWGGVIWIVLMFLSAIANFWLNTAFIIIPIVLCASIAVNLLMDWVDKRRDCQKK